MRDQETGVVTKVEKLEPLSLRKEWMNNLAQAVAFLEAHGLAHGDLRPENILLNRDQLNLSDFDSTSKIGSEFEACIAPYGRLLNETESAYGQPGDSGCLSARTEQFALGSLFYLVSYGFEVYGDRVLTEDPREHGPERVDLLQHMKFPELNGDRWIDSIISNCWHHQYSSISDLSHDTQNLLDPGKEEAAIETKASPISRLVRGISAIWSILFGRDGQQSAVSQTPPDDSDECATAVSKRNYCQDLVNQGLLSLLTSGEPEQLGFPFEWYRNQI